MSRVYNFSAGPAALPLPVLERAREELLDWNGQGASVMEVSHRGKPFTAVAEKAEQDLRDLLAIPDNYSVLFCQGGASQQFAMIPLNLISKHGNADYVNTGLWSTKAIQEAQRYADVNVVASSEADKFTAIPAFAEWQLANDAAYVHYTPNETVHGVEFHWIPETGDVPLVADMSSTILSRPVDVSKFGLIYAGAQKNIGPAGLTIVIVRNDLLNQARQETPTMLNYTTFADNGSMYNTPPTYSWYLAGLVFEWLKEQGGLSVMAEKNQQKADALYAAIDDSDFYNNPVDPDCRSWMNVPFVLANPELDAQFVKESNAAGLSALKGHRLVGGMRASLYNAVNMDGVNALIDFMRDFEQKNG